MIGDGECIDYVGRTGVVSARMTPYLQAGYRVCGCVGHSWHKPVPARLSMATGLLLLVLFVAVDGLQPRIRGRKAVPGLDYPTLSAVPTTTFSCLGRPGGFYADPETRCQVFHICPAYTQRGVGAHQSFLCPNGTVFNTRVNTCDWWNKVHCPVEQSEYSSTDKSAGVPSLKTFEYDDDLHESPFTRTQTEKILLDNQVTESRVYIKRHPEVDQHEESVGKHHANPSKGISIRRRPIKVKISNPAVNKYRTAAPDVSIQPRLRYYTNANPRFTDKPLHSLSPLVQVARYSSLLSTFVDPSEESTSDPSPNRIRHPAQRYAVQGVLPLYRNSLFQSNLRPSLFSDDNLNPVVVDDDGSRTFSEENTKDPLPTTLPNPVPNVNIASKNENEFNTFPNSDQNNREYLPPNSSRANLTGTDMGFPSDPDEFPNAVSLSNGYPFISNDSTVKSVPNQFSLSNNLNIQDPPQASNSTYNFDEVSNDSGGTIEINQIVIKKPETNENESSNNFDIESLFTDSMPSTTESSRPSEGPNSSNNMNEPQTVKYEDFLNDLSKSTAQSELDDTLLSLFGGTIANKSTSTDISSINDNGLVNESITATVSLGSDNEPPAPTPSQTIDSSLSTIKPPEPVNGAFNFNFRLGQTPLTNEPVNSNRTDEESIYYGYFSTPSPDSNPPSQFSTSMPGGHFITETPIPLKPNTFDGQVQNTAGYSASTQRFEPPTLQTNTGQQDYNYTSVFGAVNGQTMPSYDAFGGYPHPFDKTYETNEFLGQGLIPQHHNLGFQSPLVTNTVQQNFANRSVTVNQQNIPYPNTINPAPINGGFDTGNYQHKVSGNAFFLEEHPAFENSHLALPFYTTQHTYFSNYPNLREPSRQAVNSGISTTVNPLSYPHSTPVYPSQSTGVARYPNQDNNGPVDSNQSQIPFRDNVSEVQNVKGYPDQGTLLPAVTASSISGANSGSTPSGMSSLNTNQIALKSFSQPFSPATFTPPAYPGIQHSEVAFDPSGETEAPTQIPSTKSATLNQNRLTPTASTMNENAAKGAPTYSTMTPPYGPNAVSTVTTEYGSTNFHSEVPFATPRPFFDYDFHKTYLPPQLHFPLLPPNPYAGRPFTPLDLFAINSLPRQTPSSITYTASEIVKSISFSFDSSKERDDFEQARAKGLI